MFITCDLNTEKRINLEVARTLVSTSSVNLINKTLKVRIDGVTFTIRVLEEIQCSCQHTNEQQNSDGEESNSCWDSDGENSRDPTPATIKELEGKEGKKGPENADPSVVSDARGQDCHAKSTLGPTQGIMASPISMENNEDLISTEGNIQSAALIDEESGKHNLINFDGGSVNGSIPSQHQVLKDLEKEAFSINSNVVAAILLDNQVGHSNKDNGPTELARNGPIEEGLLGCTKLNYFLEEELRDGLIKKVGQNSDNGGLGPILNDAGAFLVGEVESVLEPHTKEGCFTILQRNKIGISSIDNEIGSREDSRTTDCAEDTLS